ncbi:protein phosphatase 5 [Pluteus cervinus]|uniref:Protein phosphatase 5 n=1 Tax=Pluteus cervinus TaxID=181527 RepID=A0ACD3B8B0_9AGAR|nr:protein phosphatase 5 [Pluteus cervinus]
MSESDISSSLPSPQSTPPSSVPSPELKTLSLDEIIVSDEDRAEAANLKAEANKIFGGRDFPAAIRLYSQAIEKNPKESTIWCNRAFARMRLEEFGYAVDDLTRAIEIDPKYVKAYYRRVPVPVVLPSAYRLYSRFLSRAKCYMQMMKPQDAVTDFKTVLVLEPNNDTVKGELAATRKYIRMKDFEKAIGRDEQDAVIRCRAIIADGGCDPEKSYTGPKLEYEDGKFSITAEFIQGMIQWFKDGKTLPKRYVWEIVLGAFDHFIQEESMVQVNLEEGMTCDVIGDVHGQFYDLLHLYSLTGPPTDKHLLLMNGDLVDRGSWSIEVILTAFAYKWLYPRSMYINRGNHEANDMNRSYGFEGEAKHKHGEQTFKLFSHVFTAIPLATLLSATKAPSESEAKKSILSPEGFKRYFVVHGGLFSTDDVTLDDIRNIDRVGRQPTDKGLMCELLWTDPRPEPGRGSSKRGVGIAFGPDVTKKWCTLNGVSGIIRSHEVRQTGYEVEHDGLCTTVFSAPNYVDQCGNKGAFIRIDSAGHQEYTQFDATPHPPMKPMAYVNPGLLNLMS